MAPTTVIVYNYIPRIIKGGSGFDFQAASEATVTNEIRAAKKTDSVTEGLLD